MIHATTPEQQARAAELYAKLPAAARPATIAAGIVALCIWREARGCSPEAKLAVANVIRNRTLDPRHRWPADPIAAVLQPWQFSSFNAADPNNTKFPRPDSYWEECCSAAINSSSPDPSKGANSYYSVDIAPPKWADPAKLTASIGPFRFYRL